MSRKEEIKEKIWIAVGFMAMLLLIFFSFFWLFGSIKDVINHFFQGYPDKVVFYRDQFIAIGELIALVTIVASAVKVKYRGYKLTDKEQPVFNKLLITGVVLLFALPALSHIAYNVRYANNPSYYYCEAESSWWLHSLTKVYVKDMSLCGADH